MYEGLPDRIKSEIVRMDSRANVIASADRKYDVWKGACHLASLSSFASCWVSYEDYQEYGPAIVHKKCH
jgi:actin-related protein